MVSRLGVPARFDGGAMLLTIEAIRVCFCRGSLKMFCSLLLLPGVEIDRHNFNYVYSVILFIGCISNLILNLNYIYICFSQFFISIMKIYPLLLLKIC